jgi:predicted  nucleic acid-binding Zn-ribbon protein
LIFKRSKESIDVDDSKSDNDFKSIRLTIEEIEDLLARIYSNSISDIISVYGESVRQYTPSYYHDRISKIVDEVNSLIRELHELARDMERSKGKYKSGELSTHIIATIERSKHTLISVISSSKQLSVEYNYRSLRDLHQGILSLQSSIAKILKSIGDAAGSHRRVLYEFFPKEAKALKDILLSLKGKEDEMHSMERLIKERLDTIERCINLISKVKSSYKEYKGIEESIAAFNFRLDELRSKERDILAAIAEIDDDRDYKLMREMQDKYKHRYSMLLNDLSKAIAKIARAINKYSYEIGFSREEMLILERVTGNTEDIMNIDKDKLIAILRKVYEALYTSRIQMKDSDKDAKNILMLIDGIDGYIIELKKYNDALNDLNSRMAKYTTKLHELKILLDSTRRDIKDAEDKLLSYTRSLESLSVSIDKDMNGIKNIIDIVLAKDTVIVK